MSKRRGLHRVSSDNQCLSLRSHILVESRGDFLQTRWSILPIYSVTRIGDHARTESGFSLGRLTVCPGLSHLSSQCSRWFSAALLSAHKSMLPILHLLPHGKRSPTSTPGTSCLRPRPQVSRFSTKLRQRRQEPRCTSIPFERAALPATKLFTTP